MSAIQKPAASWRGLGLAGLRLMAVLTCGSMLAGCTLFARHEEVMGGIPTDAEGWVPEHFYAEVLGVIRRQLVIERLISEAEATAAVDRLRRWHLHRASVHPLIDAAWRKVVDA